MRLKEITNCENSGIEHKDIPIIKIDFTIIIKIL